MRPTVDSAVILSELCLWGILQIRQWKKHCFNGLKIQHFFTLVLCGMRFNLHFIYTRFFFTRSFLHYFEITLFINSFFTQIFLSNTNSITNFFFKPNFGSVLQKFAYTAAFEGEYQLAMSGLIHDVLKIHYFYTNYLFYHERKKKFIKILILTVFYRNLDMKII